MALGRVVAVMGIQVVDLGRGGEGGAGGTDEASVEQHAHRARAGAEGARGQIARDPARFQILRRRRHAKGVEQQERGEMPHLRRNPTVVQTEGELPDPLESGQPWCIHEGLATSILRYSMLSHRPSGECRPEVAGAVVPGTFAQATLGTPFNSRAPDRPRFPTAGPGASDRDCRRTCPWSACPIRHRRSSNGA